MDFWQLIFPANTIKINQKYHQNLRKIIIYGKYFFPCQHLFYMDSNQLKVNYAGINYSKDDESISPSNISAKEAAEAEEFFSTKFVTENP